MHRPEFHSSRRPAAFASILVASLTIQNAEAAAPVAFDDVIAGKADTQLVLDYLLLNDTDADGNTLNITAVGAPAHGTLTALGGNSYRYTPTAGYAGRDTFTYTVADGTGGTDSGLVTISVNAAYDIEAARTAILAGVTQIADPTQPGYMALWGPTAASISNYPGDSENHSMIAAATLGAGRVVAMPDHQWLVLNSYGGLFNTGTFYENAITWAAGTASKTVPIVTIDSNVATWLTARGYTQVVTTNAAGLSAALANADVCIPGWLGSNPSAALMTAVTDFASTGNALIICDYSPGYSWWWGKSKWDIPGSKVLREAGIAFAEDDYTGGPFTINRANDQMTLDTLIAILNNPAGYSQNLKDIAAATLTQLSQSLGPNDIAYARLLATFNNVIGTITPTPQAPVTDSIHRALLDFECNQLSKLAPASMTPHRAALPVSAAAPRVTNATFALTSPPAGHSEKTIYTPFYAAPGELVTITFPAALTTLNLDVRTSHLRSGSGQGSYTVMPTQMINRDVTSTSVQVANPHGGLIQIIVPSNVTWTGPQNITVTGAVQAPYFKLGTTTDAQWVAGIRDRGTPFGVIDSPEATLVIDADKWLRTLADPEAVITEWNYFCGKLREFYVYNPGRQLPVHHDYYPAGGVSTYPQSYGLNDEITHSLNLKATAYSLTLHEYGHICDSGNIQFDEFGETSPNMGGKWIQETERKYAWKQELVVGRINNYLASQSDDLWHNHSHHAVDWKGTPFDVLAAEFGAEMIQDCVAAMTAMASIPTSQGKIDEWARQLSNRSGFNMCAFLASWQLDVSAAVQTELSGLPGWMPVERAPESLTLVQNSTATFTNPAGNDFSYDGGLTLGNFSTPAHGTVTNNGNGTWTYTPTSGYTGADSFTYSVSNATGNVFTTTIPVRVVAPANDPKLVAFDGVANGSTWTTVTLEKSYASMVVVAQPLASAGAPPLASRIRNASGSSFEVRLDRLDGSATPVGPTGVRFLVVEAGVYNEATHGIKMEAVKFNSDITDRAGSFTGSTRDFAYTGYDHYFIPAVFGQVMTSNDAAWSAFWFDPLPNRLRLGKHVGEDPDTTRADETIGYIVIESGSYQFGNHQLQVGVSNFDAFTGFDLIGEGGGSHTFTRFPTIHSAQISASVDVPWGGSDPGLDGFVAMQATAGGNTLSGYLTEDSLLDAERTTGTKSTAYLLAHRSDGAPFAKADQTRALAGKQTLIDVTGNDDISGVPVVTVTQPENGSVVVHTDGKLIYTPTNGYTGNDAFTYTVNNGSGSTTAPVFVQVIASAAVQAGITADRFNSITGGSISNLTSSANYPNNPSTRTTWTTVNSGQNVGDNLGHRVYGVVVAPTTGDYTFWIASDDASQLSLSSDTNPANATIIASVSGWTGYQAWDTNSAQKSAVKTLTGGKAYYLEILHKEGGGGDHVSVAWEGPGFTRKLLATPDIYTAGENAPVLVAAPSNVSVNEGAAPTVIDLSGVFSSTDPGDPLTLAIHGNSKPTMVGTAVNGNQLTLTYSGLETGTATITLRATDRTGTLVTTSFTVTVDDINPDSDGDGLTDSWEVTHFGNLTAQTGSGDADSDGLNNAGELAAATDPNDTDCDNDGFSDGFEVSQSSDPLDAQSVPDSLAVAHWDFDDSSVATTSRDRIGAVTGSLLSGAVLGPDGSGRSGQPGDRCLDLGSTAASQRMDVNNVAFLQQAAADNELTITYWQKLDVTGVQRSALWAVSPTSGDNQRGIQAHTPWSTGVAMFDCGNSSAGYRVSGTPSGVTWTGWCHIALVRKPGIAEIWVNGVRIASGTGMQALPTDFTLLHVGSGIGGTNSMRGEMDDFAVFRTGLSGSQIAALMAGAEPQDLEPNRPPAFTANPIVKSAATEDAAYTGSLAANATDPDVSDTLTFTKVSGSAWLSVASNGALTGTPGNGDVGPHSFTVRVTDGSGLSDDAVLSITVNNANDAPVFAADPMSGGNATEDTAYSGTLAGAASDIDAGDTLTYLKVSGPSWLNVASNGALTGTPGNGNVGPNTFTVRVTDGGGLYDEAALNITVANVNDAPVFTVDPINLAATEDSAFTGQLAATDVDAGETLTFTKVSGPAWLTVSTSGALSGMPLNGNVGPNVFTVRVTDGSSAQDDATLNITVSNVNDAPVFTVDPILAADANVGTAYTGQTLAGRAADADAGDTIAYSKVSGPAWLAVASNGTLSGTPPAGSGGLNTFVVRATDGSSTTDDAELRINVAGLPLPWTNADIGTGMLAGSATYGAGTFTEAGSGALGGTTDKLQYVYQTLTGDGEIIARINSLQNTGSSSRVGVMIRDTLATNSKQIFMGLTSSGSYRWVRRSTTGGSNSTTNSSTGTVPNTWVRLVRSGSTITAYKSSNGTSWTSVGSTTVTMAANCYIGLAVSSGSNTTLNTSQFSSVSVTP